MSLLLVPLDESIVFPSVSANLAIDVGEDDQVFLLSRRDGEFERVGVVAEVIERGLSPRGEPVATVVGLHRGLAGVAHPDENDPDALRIDVQEIHDGQPDDEHTKELA
ncbi:MAG: endopeptidase La, partial [Solirubrobacterales bacterium]